MKDVIILQKLKEILKYALSNHLPFFAYKLPKSEIIEIGIQKDLDLMSFHNFADLKDKQGFVFAPFDSAGKHKSWFIREDFNFSSGKVDQACFDELSLYKNEMPLSRNKACIEGTEADYFSQITDILKALKEKELDKAVLSRIHVEKNDKGFDSSSLFFQLCENYPKAFVSFVSLPGDCSWMGASPELLFKSEKDVSETVALAATLPMVSSNLSDIKWGQKEIEEQAFVSRYIEDVFKANSIDVFERKGPYTVQAGQIVHLKTEFKTETKLCFENKAKIISALHPTPAVCGLPKQKALELINSVETHDREYYAGYWGLLKKGGNVELYVNLRTMKIAENQLSLFVGGGITADSIPQDEWVETQNKAQTLLSVIRK
ncbi:isochorismate synthase [Ancylomarina sp. 16SWW S1-10-2]|uniref:isochorismate synthase n=1 Tax=Ancylomarina sp. 16SWW S1-10-2 TaxID=2499681 RepID=UPI0012AE358E|nr:isochorismate synthase [Ancylomarina sp. 16SWW S1-10-2]MRT94855.1 isochorismate synthase [Ancylomarina sp. 16SWW S1-10-2]